MTLIAQPSLVNHKWCSYITTRKLKHQPGLLNRMTLILQPCLGNHKLCSYTTTRMLKLQPRLLNLQPRFSCANQNCCTTSKALTLHPKLFYNLGCTSATLVVEDHVPDLRAQLVDEEPWLFLSHGCNLRSLVVEP